MAAVLRLATVVGAADSADKSAGPIAKRRLVRRRLAEGGTLHSGLNRLSGRRWQGRLANGLIYGLTTDGTNGKMEVFTVDGKSVATNLVPSAKVEGEKRNQIRAQDRVPKDAEKGVVAWQWFRYSCPFMIDGDRIFIRSNDELWCVGVK